MVVLLARGMLFAKVKNIVVYIKHLLSLRCSEFTQSVKKQEDYLEISQNCYSLVLWEKRRAEQKREWTQRREVFKEQTLLSRWDMKKTFDSGEDAEREKTMDTE